MTSDLTGTSAVSGEGGKNPKALGRGEIEEGWREMDPRNKTSSVLDRKEDWQRRLGGSGEGDGDSPGDGEGDGEGTGGG